MEHTDITQRADIEQLISDFYTRVQANTLLAPLFSHVDWPAHLPTMYNFWASIVLGEQSYRGNPFQKHMNLPLQKEHFATWLKLFTETVDAHFEGTQATEIKSRAYQIGQLFQHRMGLEG